jgi:hypothetical protein
MKDLVKGGINVPFRQTKIIAGHQNRDKGIHDFQLMDTLET